MWSKEDYEKYAISVLEFFYSEYENMMKKDSPDFQKSELGVEVTRSITTKDGEVDAFWRNNQNNRFQDLPKKQLKKLGFTGSPTSVESNGILYVQRSIKHGSLYYYWKKTINDFVLCAYIGKTKDNKSTADVIITALSKKLKKLNNNYTLFKRNDLCIIIQEQVNYFICQEELIDDLLNIIILSIKETYNKTKLPYVFDNIILLFLDNVFFIDSKTWQYERHIITQENIDSFLVQMKNIFYVFISVISCVFGRYML
ncbi:MAG: hypothetical protein IJI47_02330 [Eubacterium sp.]|nr:hypothetical protein [Eubacterium sp.]